MQNLEIERKYLIVLPDEEFLKSRDGCIVRHITQTYLLHHENDVERRIRKIEDGKNTFYVYTEKRPKSSTTRLEDERDITEDEYNELMKERYSYLTKTRYAFPYSAHTIEIDVYPYEIGGDALVGRAVMEVELKDENEKIDFPSGITVIRELTGTREFSNKTLAKRVRQSD